MATTKAELTKQIEAFIERVATDIQATGRRQQAYRAFETATVGMRGPRVQLEDIARRASGSATEGAVSSYAEQMVTALKNLENVAGIKPTEFQNAASAIISDVMSFVRSNPLLTDAEKQEIEQFAAELQQYAAKRSAFSTRTKGAVRGLTTKMRGSLADAFLASNDIVSRGIGRLLQGRSVGREERQREIASIREGTTYDASALSGDVMGDAARRGSLISRFTTPRSTTGQFQKLAVGESKFLDYQAAILQELQLIRKGDEERDEQAELAAELGQTVYQGAPRTVSGVGQARGASKTKGTWFDTIANLMGSNGLGGLLGSFKTLSSMASMTLLPALGGLVVPLTAVAGAAVLAYTAFKMWESHQKLKEQTKGALDDEKRFAQERSGGKIHAKAEDWTLDEARKYNAEWVNKKKSEAALMEQTRKNAAMVAGGQSISSTGMVQGGTFAEGAFADAAPLESLGGGRALPSVPTVTSVATLSSSPSTSPTRVNTDSSGQFKSKKDFIDTMYPYAVEAANQLGGVDPNALLTQWGFESAWGSKVTGDYNYFGIKADDSWKGDRKDKMTHEVFGGKKTKLPQSFRSYGNIGEAVGDYVSFLKKNKRYTKAGVFQAKTAGQYFSALQTAGYATDPKYAEKLTAATAQTARQVSTSYSSGVSSSRSAAPVSAGTTQLAAAQTAAPVVMMVNASRGSAVAPPQPMPVPLPVRPRDPSMEPLSRV